MRGLGARLEAWKTRRAVRKQERTDLRAEKKEKKEQQKELRRQAIIWKFKMLGSPPRKQWGKYGGTAAASRRRPATTAPRRSPRSRSCCRRSTPALTTAKTMTTSDRYVTVTASSSKSPEISEWVFAIDVDVSWVERI